MSRLLCGAHHVVEVVVLEHHDHTLLKTVLDVARRVPHVAFAALPEHLAHRLLHLTRFNNRPNPRRLDSRCPKKRKHHHGNGNYAANAFESDRC